MTAPPWGKFNYEDWFGSPDVQLMCWKERMLYGDLLKFHWVRGYIPADVNQAARMVGVLGDAELAEFADLFAAVVHKFKPKSGDSARLISPRQDKERKKAIAAWEQKKHAGRESGKSRTSKDKATSVPTVVPTVVPTNAATDIDIDIDIEGTSTTSASHDARNITPQVLVGEWVKLQPIRPSSPDLRKQGAAAKRLCSNHDDEAIETACNGMGKLYPHSKGEPWDLFDLERKFSKAVQASMKGGPVKGAWLDDLLNEGAV